MSGCGYPRVSGRFDLALVADERGNGAFERAGAVAQFADDPQLDSVIEGRHRQSEADPVDENGDALEFGEKLSVSLTPAGTADAQDLAPSMDPVDIAANGRERDTGPDGARERGGQPRDARARRRGRGRARLRPQDEGDLSLAIEDATRRLVEARPEDDIRAALTAAMATAMGDHGLKPVGDSLPTELSYTTKTLDHRAAGTRLALAFLPWQRVSKMAAACSMEGCGEEVIARGLCCRHYHRLRRYGNPLKIFRRPRGMTLV